MDKEIERGLLNVIIVYLMHELGVTTLSIKQDDIQDIIDSNGSQVSVFSKIDPETKTIHLKLEFD
jgi:hypothetical protein